MNDQVRRTVRERMKNQGITHQELAVRTGIERPNITRLLSSNVGKVPNNWQKVLDALDLELIAVPRQEETP